MQLWQAIKPQTRQASRGRSVMPISGRPTIDLYVGARNEYGQGRWRE